MHAKLTIVLSPCPNARTRALTLYPFVNLHPYVAQDDHENPADPDGLPILCEHFAFVALHAMRDSLPTMPRFCDRLWASQERLAPDATLHAAVVAVHAAAGGEGSGEEDAPTAPVAALPVLPAAAAEPLPSTESVVRFGG